MDRSGFKQANLSGAKNESYAVEELVYEQPLPGDILFHAILPVSSLRNLEEFEKSYDHSSIELHFDKENYRSVENAPILEFKQIEALISQMEETLNILKHHESIYAKIEASKPGVFTIVKNYTTKMVKAASPVEFDKSMAEPMYLKAKFVSSVYLRSLVQIQIYVAKVFASAARYASVSLTHH